MSVCVGKSRTQRKFLRRRDLEIMVLSAQPRSNSIKRVSAPSSSGGQLILGNTSSQSERVNFKHSLAYSGVRANLFVRAQAQEDLPRESYCVPLSTEPNEVQPEIKIALGIIHCKAGSGTTPKPIIFIFRCNSSPHLAVMYGHGGVPAWMNLTKTRCQVSLFCLVRIREASYTEESINRWL